MSCSHISSEITANLPIVKFPRAIEAFLELVAKLLGLCIVYFLFNLIGDQLLDDEFRPDMLLSLVVLPAIYILKDFHTVFEPFFIGVLLSDKDVTVESGILTKRRDCLSLKTVENVELVTTILGRVFDYGTLNIYAYGSWVEIPHIRDASSVQAKIEGRVNK